MLLRWWRYFWDKRDEVAALDWKDAELARIVLRIHRHRRSVDWRHVPLRAIAPIHPINRPTALAAATERAERIRPIAEVLLASGIDGLICTNTTIDRGALAGHRHAHEAGGLSGAPVFAKSTAVLAGMAKRTDGRLPIVGVGGILGGTDAQAKIAAGASLVQFYTGLIYRGPELIGESVEAIRAGRGF